MIKQTFKIFGMHCTACALNIDLDLEELKGVKEAKTSYARGVTAITFDDTKISPEILKSTIAKTGYKVVD